ncbi:MAG: uroporphyrinogen-III synthase [Magnetococcales bacterium]|nr:uroporphyrinogen-III synthase [Magnetococcales bacterium]HIJ83214.1 uroporphyrinogen-III synthase [Magnetococcales bacterium]
MNLLYPEPSTGLAGRLVLITRPLPEALATAQLVERHGAIAKLAPVLEKQPPDDPEPLLHAVADLRPYAGIVFTSVHAVRAFLDLPRAPHPIPKMYAVGNQTAALLIQAGNHPIVPKNPVGGNELAMEILDASLPEDRFLFLRAQEGREELIEILHQAGRNVERVAAYKMAPACRLDSDIHELLEHQRVDAIPFFSGRSAQIFFGLLPEAKKQSLLTKPILAALSPTTAQVMKISGIRVDLVCERPHAESMIAALAQAFKTNRGLPDQR